MGLAGAGGLTLAIEAMKLPLAIHLVGARGIYRVLSWVGVVFLCSLTFLTMKDMVNNQGIVALAPARTLQADADRLDLESARLEESAGNRGEAAAAARENLASLEVEERTRVGELRDRRGEVAAQWRTRIDEVREGGLFDEATRARLDALDGRRATLVEETDRRLDAIDASLEEARAAHAAAVDAATSRHREATEAFEREMARRDEARTAARADAMAAAAAADARYQAAMKDFDAACRRLEESRREIGAELERRIAMHRKNDGAFYGLEGKIAEERRWAADEFARLDRERASLTPPLPPVTGNEGPADAGSDTLPRPVLDLPAATEVARLLAERTRRIETRDRALADVDAERDRIRESALQVAEDQRGEMDVRLASLTTARDARLAEIDAEIRRTEQVAAAKRTRLAETAVDDAAVQAFVASTLEQVAANDAKAVQLRHDAQKLLEDTEVYRMASFLAPFLPNATVDERIDLARSGQAIVLGLIVAVAPAMLLKSAVHHLLPIFGRGGVQAVQGRRARRTSWWRGLGADRLRRTRDRLARAAAVEVESMRGRLADRDASHAAALDAAHADQRSALDAADAAHRVAVAGIEAARDAAQADARTAAMERDAIESARAIEIEGLRTELDAASRRADETEAGLKGRIKAIEEAAAAREERRSATLAERIRQAEIEAKHAAQRSWADKLEASEQRNEALRAEKVDLERDRRDLLDDNRAQRDQLQSQRRTIDLMREELERAGRAIIELHPDTHDADAGSKPERGPGSDRDREDDDDDGEDFGLVDPDDFPF